MNQNFDRRPFHNKKYSLCNTRTAWQACEITQFLNVSDLCLRNIMNLRQTWLSSTERSRVQQFFFKMRFTPSKAEQQLGGMELRETEAQKN